jgi:hypothetical protein
LLEALTDDDDGRDAEGEPSPEPADPRRRIEELLG